MQLILIVVIFLYNKFVEKSNNIIITSVLNSIKKFKERIKSPNKRISDNKKFTEPVVIRGNEIRVKLNWSEIEVNALLKGYKKYSDCYNIWVSIKNDINYSEILAQRSPVDLKDKIRNLGGNKIDLNKIEL